MQHIVDAQFLPQSSTGVKCHLVIVFDISTVSLNYGIKLEFVFYIYQLEIILDIT